MPKEVAFNPGIEKRQVTTQTTDNYYRVKGADIPAPLETNTQRLEAALDMGVAKLKSIADDEKKEKDAEDERRAKEILFTNSFDEIKNKRERGELPPSDDTVFNMALDRGLGIKRAEAWSDKITSGITDGSIDVNTIDDVDEWVRQSLSEEMETLGESGNILIGGFTDGVEKVRSKVRSEFKRVKSTYMVDEAKQSIFSEITTVIEEGKAAGESPAHIQKMVHELSPGYRDLYGFDGKIVDQEVLKVASSLAEQDGGNYEIVEALLGDRAGTGSISGKRDLAAQSEKIIELARTNKVKKLRSDHFETGMDIDRLVEAGAFTEDKAREYQSKYPEVYKDREKELRGYVKASNNRRDALLKAQKTQADKTAKVVASQQSESDLDKALADFWNKGRGLDLPQEAHTLTESGGTKTHSYDALKKRMINGALAQSEVIAKRDNETPMKTLAREVNKFSHSGFDHPVLKRKFDTFASIIHTLDVTGPESFADNENFKDILARAKYVKAVAPQYFEKLTSSSQSKDALNAIIAIEKYKGVSPEEAAHIWYQLSADKANGEAKVNSNTYEALDIAVQNIASFPDDWGWQEESVVENTGQVMGQVERLARLYVGTGLNADQALEAAGKDVMSKMTVINGHAVYTGDIETWDGFGKAAKTAIEKYAQSNKLDKDDLTIQSLGNTSNQWVIVYKTTNTIAKFGSKGSIFSTRKLHEQSGEWAKERKASMFEEIDRTRDSRREFENIQQMRIQNPMPDMK